MPRDDYEMPMRFALTEQHLTLLRGMYVEWGEGEAGAPAIDPNRPYGNSDVAWDVCELLGWPSMTGRRDALWTDEQEAWGVRAHQNRLTAPSSAKCHHWSR